jgi:hypothetical protein
MMEKRETRRTGTAKGKQREWVDESQETSVPEMEEEASKDPSPLLASLQLNSSVSAMMQLGMMSRQQQQQQQQ